MGGAAAAAAAAERRRKRQQEEEMMTSYSDDELRDNWEFKIVRSASGAFRKPEELRKLIERESRGGWVLVEKFDNERVRFKRPVRARAGDASLPADYDPYGTVYGMSEGMFGLTVALIIIGAMALVVGLIMVFSQM